MNYGQVFYADTANGIGARISLFVSGCTHHCPGCFNEETWDFNFGEPFTREVEDDIIEHLRPSYIDGLSLLGGEPMEAQNQRALLPFLERVKQEVPQRKSALSHRGDRAHSGALGYPCGRRVYSRGKGCEPPLPRQQKPAHSGAERESSGTCPCPLAL